MYWEDHQNKVFSDSSTEDVINDEFLKHRVNRVIEWIGTEKKVLDIGANHGDITNLMKIKGNDVVAFDLPGVVEVGKKKFPSLTWVSGSAEEALSMFEDESFDVVVACELIEHLINLNLFLKEVNRILKKGGRLIVSTPNVARPSNILNLIFGRNARGIYYEENPPMHIRFFTGYTLAKVLSDNGFVDLKIEGFRTGGELLDGSELTKEEWACFKKLLSKHRAFAFEDLSVLACLCFKK